MQIPEKRVHVRLFESFSLRSPLTLFSLQVWTELPELITSVAFTSDGKLAIAGSFVGVCVSRVRPNTLNPR